MWQRVWVERGEESGLTMQSGAGPCFHIPALPPTRSTDDVGQVTEALHLSFFTSEIGTMIITIP